MKAWQVERLVEAGEMHLVDIPAPEPGPGAYLVQVEAAGVNFLDTLMLRGRYQRKPALPFVPGVEVAGRILAAGAGAPLAVGQRVCGGIDTGGFAEQAVVPAGAVRLIPHDVPAEIALVLLGVNYPTSYYALHDKARLQAGETVLVHAAAGGVGSAAVQIAKAAGCRVIGTAGSAAKRAACLDLSADDAVDYGQSDWVDQVRALTGGAGVDIVYDPVGGDGAVQSLRALAWQGRYLVIGFAAGTIPALPANRLLLKDAAAFGVFWGEVRERDPATGLRVEASVLALYRQGKLAPLIGGRFLLAQAREAVAQLGSRATSGKLILVNPG